MTIGNIYVITGIAVIGGSLFGFDISSMSAIIGTNQYKCYFNDGPEGIPYNDNPICSGPSSLNQGGITAAMPAGSWLGALVSGIVTDKLGRKKAIMLGCLVWIIGSIISSASQNMGMLIAGRLVNGFAVGIESAQVPVYVSELAPPSKRGRVVGAQQWAITWGILIMFYMSYGCSFIGGDPGTATDPTAFRVPWALQMLPAFCLFIGMMFLPESPRWLGKHGRWEECHSVLTLVHGKGNPDAPFVRTELDEIRKMVEFEAKNDATYLDLFKPRMLNRTMIALFTQIWSQLTGMNVMMYYITYIFSMAGYSGNANLLASSIQYIINVLMTIPALIYIDRWGRRNTMLVGAFLMGTFMFANAGLMGAHGRIVPGGVNNVASAPMLVEGPAAKGLIACTYLFVASFAPTWGPASWIYPPELFPLRVRGMGVSLATSGNWAFNTALGLFVPIAFETIMWRTYVIFGVFCFTMFIHVFFLFPETAGKTLEEVNDMFENPNGIKYIGTPAWKTRVQYHGVKAAEAGRASDPERDAVTGGTTNGHHEGLEKPVAGSAKASHEHTERTSMNNHTAPVAGHHGEKAPATGIV